MTAFMCSWPHSGLGYSWEQNPERDRHEIADALLCRGRDLNLPIWQRSSCVAGLGACAKYHCLWLSFFFFSFFKEQQQLQAYTRERNSDSVQLAAT